MTEFNAKEIGEQTVRLLEKANDIARQSPGTFSVTFKPITKVGEDILPLLIETFLEDALNLLYKEKFSHGSDFEVEFKKTSTHKYDPATTTSSQDRTGKREAGFFQDGNTRLLALLQQYDIQATGSHAELGIGPIDEVKRLPLDEFMPKSGGHGTTSQFNSFFYASEWGTGVFADEIRTEGTSKDEPTGSWWFGREAGKGIHWLGQQPRHFMLNEHGEIDKKWEVRIKQWLPEYIARVMGHYMQAINARY